MRLRRCIWRWFNIFKVINDEGYVDIKDVKIGDKIYCNDGELHKVLNKKENFDELYEVIFSDGTKTISGLNQIWHVQTRKQRYNSRKNKDYRYMELKLSDILVDYVSENNINKYSIPITKAVNFKNNEIDLDSNLLGLLLGDGCITDHRITFTNAETDLLNKVKFHLDNIGNTYEVDDRITHKRIRISNKKNNECTLLDKLKSLELIGCGSREKFIPEIYQISNVHSRLELISGIYNTDGHVVRGVSLLLSTYSEKVATQVRNLNLSLGFSSTINKYDRTSDRSSKKYDKEIEYTVSLIGDLDLIKPYLSKKHLNSIKDRKNDYCKSIVDIKYFKTGTYYDLDVDSKYGLFLTDNYIVRK